MANKLIIPLIFGSGLLALFISGGKKKTSGSVSTPSIHGIIYKCSSIEVVDKDEFKKFAETHAQLYAAKINYKMELVDYKMYIGEFIEKLNKNCYTKFVNQKLTNNEKIIILFVITYNIEGYLAELFLQDGKNEELNNKWISISDNSRNNLYNFVKWETLPTPIDQFEYLGKFFDLNGNKFPKH